MDDHDNHNSNDPWVAIKPLWTSIKAKLNFQSLGKEESELKLEKLV